MIDDETLWKLLKAIASGADANGIGRPETPGLARATMEQGAVRAAAADYYLSEISHYVYAGDAALHVAAAAYRPDIAHRLIDLGADVSARNRRGAAPLHYAADGLPGSSRWNPAAQSETIAWLIGSGADPNATDDSGVTPLHRAVRTRCAAAVGALLEGGADAAHKTGRGTTPIALATRQTGRGGSGSPDARAQQAQIVQLLERYGATT
jgi:hypothetical protein